MRGLAKQLTLSVSHKSLYPMRSVSNLYMCHSSESHLVVIVRFLLAAMIPIFECLRPLSPIALSPFPIERVENFKTVPESEEGAWMGKGRESLK